MGNSAPLRYAALQTKTNTIHNKTEEEKKKEEENNNPLNKLIGNNPNSALTYKAGMKSLIEQGQKGGISLVRALHGETAKDEKIINPLGSNHPIPKQQPGDNKYKELLNILTGKPNPNETIPIKPFTENTETKENTESKENTEKTPTNIFERRKPSFLTSGQNNEPRKTQIIRK